MSRSRRPIGQHTRGKTATNRLRQVDVFTVLALADALAGPSPLAVDVGFGAQAWTTLEMAERWRRAQPGLRVLGIEIDPERVDAAQRFADPPATRFALGGFNVTAATAGEPARVIRCYNVLRQYDEDAVADALAQMAAALEPGGVLIEGTSNPTGGMVAFDVWRAAGGDGPGGLSHAMLVFGTNFAEDLEPRDFQTILPKRLIHRMLDVEPARFFGDWERAAAIARGTGAASPKQRWAETAAILRERFGWPVDPRPRLSERGYLVLGCDLRG